MKKTMIYILALTLAFSTLLAGCGEMRDDKTPPAETPQATILPETMMPDPADGEVRDRDGIITDGDSGNVSGELPAAPQTGTMPGAGAEKQTTGNGGAGTASETMR